VFRTKTISEITNAHLADDSSSSYFGIVRLSFSVFALRDRRKKLALCTCFFSHTIDSGSSLNQSVTFSDRRTRLRHRSIASWWNFQRELFARDRRRRLVHVLHHFFLDTHIYQSTSLCEVLACTQWSIELPYGVKVAGRSSIERSNEKDKLARKISRREKRTFVVESVLHTAREKRQHPSIVVKVCRYHVRHVTRKSSWPCSPIRKKAAQALSAGQSRDLIGTLLASLSIVPNINPRNKHVPWRLFAA